MGLVTKIIFLLLLSLANSYCSNHFKPLFSECTFYYTYSDQACTNFQFIQCTWEVCAVNKTVNNVTTCDQYKTEHDSSWTSCTFHCCLYKTYPEEYASLEKCDDDLKEFYVIVGICLLIAGIKYLLQRLKDKLSSHCFSDRCRRRLWYIITCKCFSQSNHHLEEDFSTEEPEKNHNWNQAKMNKNHDSKCGVCSTTGFTVKLECGHLFHRECTTTFMKYGGQCPVCDAKCGYSVTVYCDSCQSSNFFTLIGKYNNSQSSICPNCQYAINPI